MAFRQRLWIDRRVQGVLVGRVVLYWCAGLLYFGSAVWVSLVCDHPNLSYSKLLSLWFSTIGPWIPSAALLLPLIVYDIVRLSHQFVGPVLRARTQLSRLVQSPNCTPFVLRTDDYWQDMIAPMNDVQNHIISLHVALQKATAALTGEEMKSLMRRAGNDENPGKTEPVRDKIVCLDAANHQEIEEMSSAS